MGLVTALIGKASTASKLAQAHIVARTKTGEDSSLKKLALQYWPESLQISSGVEWASKSILGASHPLKQFITCGDRTLTFTTEFSRDLQGKITDNGNYDGKAISLTGYQVGGDEVARDRYNVDVAQAVVWMESMKFPLYDAKFPGGFDPPPILWVVFPNTYIGRAKDGTPTDVFQCVMTDFSATLDAFFPDGTPRHASCQVSFGEVVQYKSIKWVGRDSMNKNKMGADGYGVTVK